MNYKPKMVRGTCPCNVIFMSWMCVNICLIKTTHPKYQKLPF